MSKQIDERVVEMTFDNKDFEANVKTSMSTIDKLKQALNFKGAEKGLDNVNAAAKRVNLSGVGNAVDAIKVKFDALQVAGTTALANITNAAVNAGRNMINSLTIAPITQGFEEYELQLNSVQTIMANTASKGTTIDQVTAALNELNTYADKTIYNFAEMTKNIGTFTAAGVDLDKSVASIKGIANLAAMSGSTSTQAATAMYQLSQALAAGKVSLMDWNSVVNAGMGGEQFQEALKRTARNMGMAVDQAIEKYGSFRESLTKGEWLTTDVLTETLKQLSGAYTEADLMNQGYTQDQAAAIVQMATTAEEAATKVKTFSQLIDTLKEAVGSGWAQTWQTIFGDFYEARDFWTNISDMLGDMVGASSDARNNLLEGAFDSNWDQLRTKIEDVGGSWDHFQEIVKQTARDHGVAVDEMINDETSLYDLIQNGSISTDIISEAFGKFIDELAGTSGATDAAAQSIQNFGEIVNRVIRGDFGNGEARVKALTEAGYDYATVQDLVNKTLWGQEINYENLSDAQLKNLGYTEEQVAAIRDLQKQAHETGSTIDELIKNMARPSGRELMFSSIQNILQAIIKPATAVREAFRDIFGLNSDQIYNFIAAFEHFTSSLVMSDESVDKLRRTFDGLFAIISILTNFVGGAFSAAFKIVQGVLDNLDIGILDVTANLGDAAVQFADFVNQNNIFSQVIQFIADRITDAIGPFNDFIGTVKESGIITTVFENAKVAFSGFLDRIKEFGSGAGEVISNFIDSLMNLDDFSLDNIINAFKEFWSNITSFFSENFGGVFDPITEAAGNVATAINDKFGAAVNMLLKFKDVVVEVVTTLMERFSGTGLAGVFAILFSAGTLALISKFISIFSKLASPIETVMGLIDGLKASFDKYAKAKSFEKMSEGIRNIAISIGIMAAAVFALGQLQPEQLWSAVGAVVALGVALGGLAAALAFLTSKGGFTEFGLGIAEIGAGILMVSTSLLMLKDIDPDSLIKSVTAVISIMGVMVALALALQKFGGKGGVKDFSGPSVQIIALAGAVFIVAQAVKSMADIQPEALGNIIVGMISVFGSLAILMGLMNKFGGGLANASGLLVTVIGLQAFIMVIQNIANMDVSNIIANLPNFIIVFGLVAGLMAASSLAGANSIKGGVGLIAMAAAMLIITQVINILGGMDQSVLDRGANALVTIGVIFAMLIAVTHLAGENSAKAGVGLIAMSAAMMIVAGAIAILGSMDEATLAKGTAVVAAIGVIFAGLIAATYLAKDSTKTIISMTVAVGVLVACVVLLSTLDPESLVPATACLTALIAAFSLMMAATKFAGKANSGMLLMLVVVGVLAGVVALIGNLPMDGAIQAAAAIGILMTTMTASLFVMSKAGNVSTSAMATMGILTGVVAALAVVLGVLTALNVAPSIETAISLSIMLGSMTAVFAVLSMINTNLASGVNAALGLASFIGILGGVFAALGELNNLLGGGISDAISGAIPIMENIGKAIGSFIGGLVGGAASGAMSALPDIGMSISTFWMNIQPFVMGMQVMGPDALNGVKTLVEMMAMITGSNMLEGLAQFFGAGNSMDNFAQNLTKFGIAISQFSMILGVGQFNAENVTAAANAGKALAEMQNAMQGSGGIFQMFEGVKDMGAFGEQLKSFGNAIVEFSKTVSAEGALDPAAVEAAANAGKVMSELQNGLAQNGSDFSVVKWFAGEQNLETFGNQIKAFGQAIVDFSGIVTGEGKINQDAVQAAANAGQIMSELEKNLDTTSGGVVGFFAGETNLEQFGNQIKAFGTAMVEFSNAVTENGGIDEGAISSAASMGSAMSELANSLPNYEFGSGKLDLAGFGNNLKTYATGISTMSSILANVDMTKINQSVNVARTVSNVLQTLQGIDESAINKFWVLDSLGTSLKDFATDVADLDTTKISLAATSAQRIADLINSLTGINEGSVAGFTEALSSLGQVSYDQIYASFSSADFSLIGVNVMSRLAEGIRTGAQNVQAQLNIMLSQLASYASMGTQDFNMAGLRLATEFATGIRNGSANVAAQVQVMVQNAANALNGYEGAFYAAGSNLAYGFANGISASSYRATVAARAMANAAKTAAEQALDEHSPSKVMQQIGEYAGEGFAIGIENYIQPAETIGESMASAVVRGASTVADLLDKSGTMSSIANSFRELSEAMDKTKKDENKTTEEAEEENSKLVDVLSSMADTIDSVVSRKQDLKSIGTLLSRTGVTFTEGFVDELLNSSGQFAGAITDMASLTDEQLQNMVDAFTEADLMKQINELTDSVDGGDNSFVDALNEAGISITEFAKDADSLGLTLDDISSKVDEFASKVSDGFSKMEIDGQTTLDEFKENLENNYQVAQEWSQNVEKVFSSLSILGDSDAVKNFKKQILEGGFDKWGMIISELAQSSQEELVGFVEMLDYIGEQSSQFGLDVTNSIISERDSFVQTGQSIADGIAQGLGEGTNQVNGAALMMCQGVESTIKNYFGIASPSKLMAKIGGYLVAGLSNGINEDSSEVKKSILNLSNTAMKNLQALSDDDFAMEVKIVPVIDENDFASKMSMLNSSFGSRPSLDVLGRINSITTGFGQNGYGSANTMLIKSSIDRLSDKIDRIDPDNFGVTYQQNNYSPKALTTADIYRKTKSQLSRYKSKNSNGGNLLR